MAEDSGKKNWLEWTVFAVGLLLTLGTVGVLVYELASQGDRMPPTIVVRLGASEKRADHYAVPVTVENKGDETAEGVHIQVTLDLESQGQPETADFNVQFLPGHGTWEGWVTFRSDPATGTLQARPLGYQKP